MKKYKLNTFHKKILSDTITPVSIYLKIRDKFPNSILLESSDYHTADNSFSYICCNPISSVKIHNEQVIYTYPDNSTKKNVINKSSNIPNIIHDFTQLFDVDTKNLKFITNGLFGYINYDAVRYFENIKITKKEQDPNIPEIYYAVYQNIIAINHFQNEAHIFANCYNASNNNIEEIVQLIGSNNHPNYNFKTNGKISSNFSDFDFIKQIEIVKTHCKKGDVFQLVLSKKFSQSFSGDEFNVYRALRSINPSPYLFYFDYGDYKIFGSSPEAQLIIKNNNAEIHPIAGTFKRTGDDLMDAELANKLSKDTKENSEHVMLVDLARNDLARNGDQVRVDKYKEVQFFSHVIHLVSKVTAKKSKNTISMKVVADTFPAGTLSGAPKYKAMELIDKYELTNRSFYGGAIGFMDFKGNFNHAIMIRTFLSKNHELIWQAGAGIISKSKSKNELQEVYNKLGALTKAIELAKGI